MIDKDLEDNINYIIDENSECLVTRSINLIIGNRYKIDGEIYLDNDYKININIIFIENVTNFQKRLL